MKQNPTVSKPTPSWPRRSRGPLRADIDWSGAQMSGEVFTLETEPRAVHVFWHH
jgi:hypothetical protein